MSEKVAAVTYRTIGKDEKLQDVLKGMRVREVQHLQAS